MKNGERYKTAAERLAAYREYCPVACAKCPLRNSKGLDACAFGWLDLEYKPTRNFENYESPIQALEAWYKLKTGKTIKYSIVESEFLKWLFDKPSD